MKHELTKEQIREIYNNPEILRELFPNVFLEVGKWYIISTFGLERLLNFSGNYDINRKPLGYGFNLKGEYIPFNSIGWAYDTIRPATNERVQEALIKEAKKRGYGKGVKVKGISSNFSFKIHGDYFKFYEDTNVLTLGDNLIFENGEWAEIIETELELTLDEIAEKFGVDKVKIKK